MRGRRVSIRESERDERDERVSEPRRLCLLFPSFPLFANLARAVRKAVLGMMAVHRMQDGGAAHASPGHRHQPPETAEMRRHLEEMKDEARKEEVNEVYAEDGHQQ